MTATGKTAVPGDLAFDSNGLIPVVVQDRASGDVLMVAWANGEALERTAETGLAHFWSRSRGELWRKGETSGNGLRVVEARADCDRDTLLLVVDPEGPACHTGARTCFGNESPTAAGIWLSARKGLIRCAAIRISSTVAVVTTESLAEIQSALSDSRPVTAP